MSLLLSLLALWILMVQTSLVSCCLLHQPFYLLAELLGMVKKWCRCSMCSPPALCQV